MVCHRVLAVIVSCLFFLTDQCAHCAKIIDGKEVVPHSMPFMALVEGNGYICGGILISPKWVLTAAHCNSKTATLGVHFQFKKSEESRQGRKVKSYPHPCYDASEKVNDLMLLKLNKPVKQTKAVKPLPLGKTVPDPKAGSTCLVAGWGKTSNAARVVSDVLRSVNVTVIDRVKCNSPKYYNGKPVITQSMICAGSDGTNQADTCGGDSGGPLLCNGALVGVTSFGIQCGLEDKPGVYSFLSKKHLGWIKTTMQKKEYDE